MRPVGSSLSVVFLLFFASCSCRAQEISAALPLAVDRNTNNGPASASGADFHDARTPRYCGIYCVQACAEALGVSVQFSQILDERYLQGQFGSSAQNLIDCADTIGLKATLKAQGGLDKLRSLNGPAILSVRPVDSLQYSHWITFLGFDGNDILIYDPPNSTGRLTPGELLAIYRGDYLEIQTHQQTGAVVPSIPWSRLMCVGICMIVLSLASKRMSPMLAVMTSVMLVAGFSQVIPGSFVRSPTAINLVYARYQESQPRLIDVAEARSLAQNRDTLFIDTRLASAFEQDHLPGAISIPIDSSLIAMKRAFSEIDQRKKLVFYCQNKNCGWGHIMAKHARIFLDNESMVLDGGIQAWREHEKG